MLAATVAQAQQAPASTAENSGGLEEIVVTAQRRSENVQNVPIAISAFTAELCKAASWSTCVRSAIFSGVISTPVCPFSGDRSVLSALDPRHRPDIFAFNLTPCRRLPRRRVLARTIGANQNLLDVDRIEIEKARREPCSAPNTIGGAISIVTHTRATSRASRHRHRRSYIDATSRSRPTCH